MRGRFLLLLILCGVLLLLQALPQEAVQAMASGEYLIYIDLSTMSLTLYRGRDEWGVGQLPLALGKRRRRLAFSGLTEGSARSRLGSAPGFWAYPCHGGSMVFMVRTSRGRLAAVHRTVASGCTPAMPKSFTALFQTGTVVIIEEGPYGELGWGLSPIAPGDRGSLVCAAQRKLRALGYYSGSLDGIYGDGMSAAVRNFRKDYGLPAKDGIDAQAWEALGVVLFE